MSLRYTGAHNERDLWLFCSKKCWYWLTAIPLDPASLQGLWFSPWRTSVLSWGMSLFQSSSPDSLTQQLVGLGASLSGSNNRSSSALPLPSSCHLYLHFPSWLHPTFANFVVSELLNNIQTRKEVPDTQLYLLLPPVLPQGECKKLFRDELSACELSSLRTALCSQARLGSSVNKPDAGLLPTALVLSCAVECTLRREMPALPGWVTCNREWQHPLNTENKGRKMWPKGK